MIPYKPIRTSAMMVRASGMSIAPVPADLAHVVSEIWGYSIPATLGRLPVQIFPSGCVIVRFNIWSDNVEAILYGPSMSNNMRGFFESGVGICGAAIRIEAAHDLLRIDVSELRDVRVNLETIWPNEIARLRHQLADTVGFIERVAAMIAFFRRVVTPTSTVKATFLNMLADVTLIANARMLETCRRHGASVRTSRRMFDRYIGLSPKEFQRVIRLQGVLRAMYESPALELSDLATSFGYSDQAHMTRELNDLVGVSPWRLKHSLDRLADMSLPNWEGLDPGEVIPHVSPAVVSFVDRQNRPLAGSLDARVKVLAASRH